MKLSPHFTLEECTRTTHGANPITVAEIECLRITVLHAEVLRALHCPTKGFRTGSGFRSEPVNKAAGGVPTSAHRYGCALDLQPLEPGVTVEKVWRSIPDTGLDFDQAIWEIRPPDTAKGEKEDVHWLHYGIARPGFGPARRMHFIDDKRRK